MGDVEAKIAGQAQDALRQLKLDLNSSDAVEILREAHRVVTLALSTDVSSDITLKSVRNEVALALPALIAKALTPLTAALGLISNCSAASRREAPLSTRAMTRPRISAEYAFGIVRPPGALDWLVPIFVLSSLLSFWHRLGIGFLLASLGVALALFGLRDFKLIGTNVNPWKPTLHLAADGVYRHLRNPMYVGLMLLTAGIGTAIGSDWTFVLLIPTALLLHYGVVLREERYLERKFGDEYRRYRARVPRWGWRIY
jgi:protein-S-isoprenylcysteine O-methyltransferase Ste14